MERCFRITLIGNYGNIKYHAIAPLPVALWDHAIGSMLDDKYIVVSGGTMHHALDTNLRGISGHIFLLDI